MKPYFALLVIPSLAGAAYVIAACSDDGNGTPSNLFPGADASTGNPSGSAPEGRPSGASIRVFNAYTPLNGEPGPIDLYPDSFVLDGAKPKQTVPYGTMSKLYDPTVKGDDGDMFLSAYWAGTTGNGNSLISQTETLKGGEVITYFITTGSSPQESGRRFGAIHAYFHQPEPGGLTVDVPAGKGLLTVDTIGLGEALADPGAYNLYFGTGTGCQKAIGDTEFSTTGVGPGSAANYALDPGSYTGTVYNDASCIANPIVQNVPFEITASGRTVLFVYAPKDKEFGSTVVPLEPKTP
jgi:hypothetical protein